MAVWDGIGFKSLDIIQTSFDMIDVAFDNTLIALFTRVTNAPPTMVRVSNPQTTITRVESATPTYIRV